MCTWERRAAPGKNETKFLTAGSKFLITGYAKVVVSLVM